MNFILNHKLASSFSLVGLCFFLLFGCEDVRTICPGEGISQIDADSLVLNPALGLILFQGKSFSGEGVSYYSNGKIAESNNYVNGKREGKRTKWFSNGEISYTAVYKDGKLQGTSKSWWKNGKLRSKSNYEMGLLEGKQEKWFKSGSIFKIQNFSAGKENGLQKAFRENGKIYANYEAKNGRTFGLIRSNLCYDLEDEKVK